MIQIKLISANLYFGVFLKKMSEDSINIPFSKDLNFLAINSGFRL